MSSLAFSVPVPVTASLFISASWIPFVPHKKGADSCLLCHSLECQGQRRGWENCPGVGHVRGVLTQENPQSQELWTSECGRLGGW